MAQFVVTFVETDGNSFGSVHAKVMEGKDPESVARARVAEAVKYYRDEHKKYSDSIAWEKTRPSRMEDENAIKGIISGWHAYYKVFVFSPDGEHLDVDLIDISSRQLPKTYKEKNVPRNLNQT